MELTLTACKEKIIEKEREAHKDDLRCFYPDPMNENDCAVCGKPLDKHEVAVASGKPFFCKTKEERKGKPFETLMDEAAELYAETKVKNVSSNSCVSGSLPTALHIWNNARGMAYESFKEWWAITIGNDH